MSKLTDASGTALKTKLEGLEARLRSIEYDLETIEQVSGETEPQQMDRDEYRRTQAQFNKVHDHKKKLLREHHEVTGAIRSTMAMIERMNRLPDRDKARDLDRDR